MMAQALAGGLIHANKLTPERLIGCDLYGPCRDAFTKLGAATTTSNADVVKAADLIIIAVKPDAVLSVLGEVGKELESNPKQLIVVSIAAGVTISTIESALPKATPVIRVMPNTPCMVREVAAALAKGSSATDEDLAAAKGLFDAVGTAVSLPESKLDAVTGLSGSGPAYGYIAIEALADGGVRMGLPRKEALLLAAQTMLGAAKMILETGEHPGLLKDKVCSPGGTTIAGVHQLELGGLRATLMNAVQASTNKSAELGKQN